MSIYVMSVGDLAKKRGEPVGEFVKKVQALGFDAGSHLKKLTQSDLNTLITLLDGTPETLEIKKEREVVVVKNPNVLMIQTENKHRVLVVDAALDSEGNLSIKVITNRLADDRNDAILEFRKELGLNLGVN